MKEKRKSKWLSLLLAGIMVLTLFPGMAMAEERAEGEGTQTICTLTEGCTLPDGHDGVCVANNAGKGENEETKERQGTNQQMETVSSSEGAAAQIGDQSYPTLEAAVAAVQSGETIVLLRSDSGNGIKVPENSNFTLDLGGYTYTVSGQTVGSTGTETLGFQLLKGSTITIKNGAITAQSAQNYPVRILIQNYSNLTLDNVKLTGDANTDYVLSNNFGDTVLKNNTVITAAEGNVAFDVYYGMADVYKDGVSVTIEDGSVQVTGKIEYGMAPGADETEFAAKANLNVPADYTGVAAPAGYEWVTTSDGAQKLQNTSYVAKVGDVAYPTLTAAVAAAQDGQTVTLLKTTTNVAAIGITGKSVIVDLNGCEIGFASRQHFNITNGGLELTGKGRVYEESPYFAPILLNGFTGEGQNNLTVGQNVVLEGWAGVFVDQTAGATNYNASVIVNGTIQSVKDNTGAAGHGVYVNGVVKNTKPGTYPVITLSDTSVVTSAGKGIYAAGYAEWNLSGQITGEEAGVEIRAGSMNVTGGKIVSNGTPTEVLPNGNGSTTIGAGLAVAQHTTRLPVRVHVSGGEIAGYTAFYQSDPQDGDPIEVSLSITGGDFNAINGGTNAVYSENITDFITGGTYSHSVNADYIAAANMETQEGGKFVIVADPQVAVAEANGGGYMTLQDAVDAAAANGGGTVTLLKSVQEDIVIPAGADITLNLPEKVTLTNLSGNTITNNGSLTVAGSGTVDNVTHARAALVNYGTAVLEGGLFTRSAEESTSPSDNGGNSYYVVDNQGDMKITGTAVVRNTGYYSSLIRNLGTSADDRANLTITGGTVEQEGFIAVKNDDYGSLTISGGVISSGEQAIQNWSDADISGGTLNGPVITWSYAGHASTTDISADAVVNGNVWAVNYDGSADIPTITITGGTVTGSLAKGSYQGGIQIVAPNADSAEIMISGGTFSAAVDEAFCADNFHPNQNADGTYSVHTHVSDGGVITTPVTNTTDGVKTYTCTICGEVIRTEIIPAHVHDAAWSCDANVHWHECPTCGRIDEAAHTFGEWTVIKAATADTAGSQERSCAVCGYKETAVIPATGEEQQGGGQQGGSQQSGDQHQSSIPSSSSQTETGDESNMVLWLALILVCSVGLGVMAIIRKKSAR